MKPFICSNLFNTHLVLSEEYKVNLLTKFLLIIFIFQSTNNIFSNINSLEHELSKIEEICEEDSTHWNGCPQNTLLGWKTYNDRLQRWYQFKAPNEVHLEYLSFLRYKLEITKPYEYETMTYVHYAPLVYARACQLRKSMSPYHRFQRLLVWVMTHSMNPVRSGSIRPYFSQILSLQKMLDRKSRELNLICFERLKKYE